VLLGGAALFTLGGQPSLVGRGAHRLILVPDVHSETIALIHRCLQDLRPVTSGVARV